MNGNSRRYLEGWSTEQLDVAESMVKDMTYAEANMHLMFELDFTIEMAHVFVQHVSRLYPQSRLAAHYKYVSLT